jgi:predicted O-methyltransferase YrrM
VAGKSSEVIESVKELLNGELADFLFIDGDHSLQGVSYDWKAYKELVRPGGLVAFHDINAADVFFESWEHGGVPRFWRELETEKQEITVGADWGGIGVVRV